MANPTPDELDLRRRARRRLIGAIAIALFAVLALPMVFDPEPQPLGDDVDIRIPSQNEPMPMPAAPPAELLAPEVAPQLPAEGEAPAELQPEPQATVEARSVAKPAEATVAVKSITEPKPAEIKPVDIKAAEAKKPEPTKSAVAPTKPPEAKAANSNQTAAKPPASYYIQLGVFSSEANARQLADKASQAGFKAQVIRSDGQYRVRVGPYAERQQALDSQAKLKAKSFSAVLVNP